MLTGKMEWVPSACAVLPSTVHTRKWAVSSPTGGAGCNSHTSPNLALRPHRVRAGHPRESQDRAALRRCGRRPPPTAPRAARLPPAGTRLNGSCSGSRRRDRPHPARPAPCLGFPPPHRGAPGSRQAALAFVQTPGPYLGRGSDCGSERPGNPRPASCGWLRSGRRQRW